MSKRKLKSNRRSALSEIKVYDLHDTTSMVDASKKLSLDDIDLILPKTPPTQVVSIRLPSYLLNELRALGSKDDIPYQALIKLFLSEAVVRRRKKAA